MQCGRIRCRDPAAFLEPADRTRTSGLPRVMAVPLNERGRPWLAAYLNRFFGFGFASWFPAEISVRTSCASLASHQRISERLLADLAAVWETRGESVLQRLALTDPGKLATIAYGLLPKDVFISVQQQTPAGLDADDWERMLGLARTMREVAPDASLEQIEHALRSAFAKPIEG
jgi:hypothetical protein